MSMRFLSSRAARETALLGIIAALLVPLISVVAVNSSTSSRTVALNRAPAVLTSATNWEMFSDTQQAAGELQIAARWTPPAGVSGQFLLDVEVRNAAGERVLQRFSEVSVQLNSQPYAATYSEDLSALAPGNYVVSEGVFRPTWGESLAWNAETSRFDVSAVPSVPTTSPASATSVVHRTTAPPAPASAPQGGLRGLGLYGANDDAAQQADLWSNSRPRDAALLRRMANTPSAIWLGDWTPDVRSAAAKVVSAAAAQSKVATLVAYNIPGRDCGSYSSGGAANEQAYDKWIDDLGAGIANARVMVIVEPDALAQLCGDAAARYRMLQHAVASLSAHSNTYVYLDAGHARWIGAPEMATRLRAAGVDKARGFALNVSNFLPTADNLTYGEDLAGRLGGKHYVIDTSRNGHGDNGQWCNPSGRALGATPTTSTGAPHADAYLWVKTPGQSDGNCNGGPNSGVFWPDYALGLARAAWG